MPFFDDGNERNPRARRPRQNELDPYGGPANSAPPAVPDFGMMFSDPYTADLERIARGTMMDLSRPFSDPMLDEVSALLRNRIGGLTSAGPIQFGGGNALLGDFITAGRQRMAELNQEPFSAAEEARYRTTATDQIGKNRTVARQNALEDAARRGVGESSGVIQERFGDIERETAANLTNAETDLAMFLTQERQRRKSEATSIAQALAAAGAQESAQADSRAIAAANLEQQRGGQVLQMAGMLADIAAQMRGEQKGRQNDVLAIAQMLAGLGPQRLALAMNVLNGTGGNDLSGLFNNTLNLSNSQAQQQMFNQQGNQQFMQGLGQILAVLANQNRRN
jgi:hypothetical protein